MSQLKIDDLYKAAKKKELNKYETFDKILIKCHNRIKLYADNRQTECLYNIPSFVLGIPLYNVNELQEYIVSSLKKNGLVVKEYNNNWIFISWNFKNKPKPKKNKNNNSSDHKFVEDYNPSGTFIINERAMLDMKEKSIKMLNF
jgi:hypothetical protein